MTISDLLNPYQKGLPKDGGPPLLTLLINDERWIKHSRILPDL